MLTLDEIVFAGGQYDVCNSTYYLNKNAISNDWCIFSLYSFNSGVFGGFIFEVRSGGNIDFGPVGNDSTLLRAAVTLSSSTKIISGDGTVNNAYVVK